MAKDNIVYQEKYKNGALMVINQKLPILPFLDDGFYPESCEIMERGRIKIGNEIKEYHIYRVVITNK